MIISTIKSRVKKELEQLGYELNIQNIALTFVPSFSDKSTGADLNKIDGEVKNTFIVFMHRNIVDKYINVPATAESFKKISKTLDQTAGDYFSLPEQKH